MRKPINLLAVLAIVITLGVLSVSSPVKTTTIRIIGRTCGSCAFSITKALNDTNGADDVRVNFEKGEAWVREPRGCRSQPRGRISQTRI